MDRQTGGEADWPGREALHDLAACLRFYSRLPVPQMPGEGDPHRTPDFARLPRMLPLAGAILALPAAVVLAATWIGGLGPFLAATLAVGTLAATTGGLHEDGLADLADGLGAGGDRDRMLTIMRDSRIGSYGAIALFLGLALRIGALATLLDRIGAAAAIALVLAAALSRLAALAPMVLLPPARSDGLSAAAGRPTGSSLGVAAALGVALCLASLPFGLGLAGVAAMAGLSALAVWPVTSLARNKLGGQTGDVIGACQQVAEIAGLLGLVAAMAP
ncbi:adenosylcobinamide-GDP ribazoletransferase [Methylobacterium persicinum]|uniref:Adenosylcobinamide-GDP ribazoletransferase n=1 Tax=Methylobacterium persicinum TaxID=374426 RepID=A0ABU0HGJ9_9HYPH|nr:adenosylcobinamide-GDP ribazoletransferase [Methylobacterium persicinum]MDQ0441441.1 adenosylcobinamide-GDP ribazoletransferase [Methylobacterium persicinum]GJE39206.1 Adenosylcobinamide-GDP ribazoletransferase [Methylobacterium persicinum]